MSERRFTGEHEPSHADMRDGVKHWRARALEATARVEALEGALEAINGVIAWSDTAEEWYLLPRLRTLPALEKVRAALGPTPPPPARTNADRDRLLEVFAKEEGEDVHGFLLKRGYCLFPKEPAPDVLMRVAEQQREACAVRMDASATVWGDMVRATPLVTE